MPALPPVADVIKCRMFWTIEGDANAASIFFLHYTSGPPSETDLNTLVGNIITSEESHLIGLFGTGVDCVDVDARDLSAMDANYATSGTADTGTRTGGRLAPGTAAVVNYSIKQSYRGGKPRNYFPFGTSTDVDTTGLWTDAFVNAYSSGVGSFFNDLIGTIGDLVIDKQCVVSYYGPPNKVITNPTTGRARTVSTRRDAPGGTGHPLVYLVTGHAGSKKIGSQRRRNRNA